MATTERDEGRPRPSTDLESELLLQREDEGDEREQDNEHWLSKRRFSTFEKGLLAICFVLLCLTSTGFGLFAGQKSVNKKHSSKPQETQTRTVTQTTSVFPSSTSHPSSPVPTQPSKKDAVCTSKDCVLQAAAILNSIDESVDACDDFYGYVNNGWIQQNPIPEGKATYGTLAAIDARNKRLLRSIIETHVDSFSDASDADRRNLRHIQDYYAACRNETLLDDLGSQPLLNMIERLLDLWRDGQLVQATAPWDFLPNPPIFQGKLPSPDPKADRSWPDETRPRRMTDTLLYLHANGISALWSSFIEADVRKNPNELKLWTQQASLGLPDPEYYKDKDTTAVDFYEKTIARTLKAVYRDLNSKDVYPTRKDDDTEYMRMAAQIITLEKRLADISWNVVDLDNPLLTYNPLSIKQLSKLTDGIVNWRDYFSGFFTRPEFPDPLIVATPSYFGNLSAIIDAQQDYVLEAYFVWRTALRFGKLLGPKNTIRQETSRLTSFLRGIPLDAVPDRSETCIQSVQDSVGFLIGHFYVDAAFPGRSKEYASEIIDAVIEAFHQRLPHLEWLDGKTRDRAQKKASAIRRKIGFPTSPNTTDPIALERYYLLQAPFNATDHFGNVLRAERADLIRTYQKVGRAPNHAEFDMIPSEVNAYYQPSANEIVFPAGILQSPLFSVDSPDYVNFGAFGAVAGHELTHAFDKAGRLYDENGKLTNWWSNTTNDEFEKLQQCVIDKYAKYYVTDENGRKYHINSKYTVGEDAADSGGLAQSFKAWQNRFGNGDGQGYNNYLLPGLNYTREQMFFIAYARAWAGRTKAQEAVRRIRTDPHSPPQFRVLGALSSSDEFAKAFKCPVGSVYNPRHKCYLW